MWTKLLFCVIVGVAFASNNPGWKDNTEYVYQIRGRTLASLHDVSNQYAGILLKAKLNLRTRSDGILSARLSYAQYAPIHTHLSEGSMSEIPESEVSYKELPLSDKPFQIVMRAGVVRDLIVEQEVSNWEANIIKSIVSQFQLDTKAQNVVQCRYNLLPEEDATSATYKTMEDSVTGTAETMYDIHLLPEHVLESKPWLVPQPSLRTEGNIIEIVKHKNFSRSENLPSYYYGFSGIKQSEPATNTMGQFFIRNSVSRAVVTGKLERYTVQNSYTVNEIIMSPTLNEQQKGSVVSVLNVTLEEIRQQTNQYVELSRPVKLGSLVYAYNHPYSSNLVREMQQKQSMSEDSNSSEETYQTRIRRHIDQDIRNHRSQNIYDDSKFLANSEEYNQQQEQPRMSVEPESPLLPFTMGYKGNSIKMESNFDIKKTVQKLSKEIGQQMHESTEITTEDTLGKFTLLTALTRIMNAEELQQVAKQLYTQNKLTQQRATWVAFRDALAQCGTGPAFLTIQELIETKKIMNEEAAFIVSTMASSVRQPTEEYMRSFFALMKHTEVKSQAYLNETCILAYTNLVRKVLVDNRVSHNQYPVHSFGKFNTESGKVFLKNIVIPYLDQQLNNAIIKSVTKNIHLYIRALGNVADKQILAVFEPFLEGKKQISQFQRMWMVVCMDKLVKAHPETARSVLFKLYQNAGESQELRVAAVYQLLRTMPSTEMLQRMADYTNIDVNEQVNSAVKSTIEHASRLEGDEFANLRSSAKAALPLLNKREYGIEQSRNYLRTYLDNEMHIFFKQTLQTIGSDDSIVPKGIKYALRSSLGGYRQQLMNVQAMVSSIEDLLLVAQEQTKHYKDAKKQQSQHGHQNKWSSENIARMLNLQSEEREQLEGLLNFNLDNFQQMISFDNNTMNRLPQVIREIEEQLRSGKQFQISKLINREEIALAFPTELGFPFLYTYDTPTLFNLEGKLQMEAKPQLSTGKQLKGIDSAHGKLEVRLVASTKVQGKLAFVTPFDHQEYSAGYDKVLQMNIPIRMNVELNLKNSELKMEIEPRQKSDAPIMHLSSWPYTSVSNILNMQPIQQREQTKNIQQQLQYSYDQILGKQETGMAFRVQMTQEQPIGVDMVWIMQHLRENNLPSSVISWLYGANIQQRNINIYQLAEESTADKIVMKLDLTPKRYFSEFAAPNSDGKLFKDSTLAMGEETLHFHNEAMRAIQASLQFVGENTVEYRISGVAGKSNVDPKSILLLEFTKKSNKQNSKPYRIALRANSNIPNTNEISLTDSMKMEPTLNSKVQIIYGNPQNEDMSKIQLDVNMQRSTERKAFLEQHPLYKQCEQEILQGNYLVPVCANMTANANLLDRVNIDIKHENVQQEEKRIAELIYGTIRATFLPYFEIQENYDSLNTNEINMQARYNPDLKSVNVSLKVGNQKSEIKNLQVNDWTRRFVVVHPLFNVRERLVAKALALKSYRPICVVDQEYATTLNNKTYPLALETSWTVMFQYLQKQARDNQHDHQQSVENQLKHAIENYVVLVRRSPSHQDQKEVKITFSAPQTEGKVHEINLEAATKSAEHSGKHPKVKVIVDGENVHINDQESHDMKRGFLQVYALPNGEVKVELNNAFYLIFDGQRVKFTAVNGKFRDSARGLCGQFNGDQTTDFLNSQNCIVRDAEDFVNSYTVNEVKQTLIKNQQQECRQKQVTYANVISNRDAGYHQKQTLVDRCTKYETRYVEQNGHICFTTRPVPTCQCKQTGWIRESVPVHCVKTNDISLMWKNQIDKGASPDFSHKSETMTVQMQIPKSCAA